MRFSRLVFVVILFSTLLFFGCTENQQVINRDASKLEKAPDVEKSINDQANEISEEENYNTNNSIASGSDSIEKKSSGDTNNEVVDKINLAKATNGNEYFGQYQLSEDGFSQYVDGNSIDRDYNNEFEEFNESENFSTEGFVELETKYRDVWDAELNNTYEKLINELGDSESKKMQESQTGWLQFHISETEFMRETWEKFGLGSQGRVSLLTSEKNRIKRRALELMEYRYMLNGKIEFVVPN